MSNPFNGSNRGMRAGASDRPSRKSKFNRELEKETHATCHTKAVIMANAIFMENAEVSEVVEVAKGYPQSLARQSLTSRLFLRLKRRVPLDVIDLKGRQPDRMNANMETVKVMVPNGVNERGIQQFKSASYSVHKMMEVSNPKVLQMSDTTLLTKGKPCADIEDSDIKRETSVTKVIKHDRYDGMISGDAIRQSVKASKEGK